MFLLLLVGGEDLHTWPQAEPWAVAFFHDQAVKAYRKQVRVLREQGKSFAEAQRFALTEHQHILDRKPARSNHPSESYWLGLHVAELSEAGTVTIGNEGVIIQLDQDETYRLHLALAHLFAQQPADPTNRDTPYATC